MAATISRGRRGGIVPLVALDPHARVPLYEQMYGTIRDAIVRSDLAAGARLASSRTLALELAVSRFTVVAAMDRLLAEGYLVSRRGAGTFVAGIPPEATMQPSGAAARASRRQGQAVEVGNRAPAVSARGAALSRVVITGPRWDDSPRPFHPRRPALDVFPGRTWGRLVARHWRSPSPRDLDYGDPAGFRPLREAIAAHIGVSRAVRCDPRQVIVTAGAQQAFDILFRVLLDPGDRVWMEEPGYLDVRAALVGAGASLVPVPVDGRGLDVARGIALAPDARLVVVSPSHQYPTGATLSAPRRASLLEWARAAGAWIVEDDYDSHFRYRGRPIPALQRYDVERAHGCVARVVYVGTFSKTMFPALRLGFCVVPHELVEVVTNARAVASRNAPSSDQAALASFIRDGDYDRHLRRARLVYEERYDAMRAAFARELTGVVSLMPAAAGTHVLGWLEPSGRRRAGKESEAVRISRAAAEEGLVIFPLSRYCVVPPARDALVLGYGGLTPRQIRAGAARLARLIEGVRRERG